MQYQPRLPLLGLASVLVAAPAFGQNQEISFSIDWHGPTISQPASGVIPDPITEADMLQPTGGVADFGPLPPPDINVSGDLVGLQLFAACVGHAPGVPCGIEIDALSYGNDHLLDTNSVPGYRIWFSVDEYALGDVLIVGGIGPNVFSEASVSDASSDLFVSLDLPPGPVPPLGALLNGNAGTLDGDGERSAGGNVYRGLGLREPNPPTGGLPNLGDNLDAFNLGPRPLPGQPIFFSLEGGLTDPHPLATALQGSDSAFLNGFQPGDILVSPAGGGLPSVYALGLEIGLTPFDDINALIISENGIPGFQRSIVPYDWTNAAAATDMVIFSVRRGSQIVGQLDSLQGIMIEPGDLLIPGPPGASTPGILIAAEAMGLNTTRCGVAPPGLGDDVDGMDAMAGDDPYTDCNGNGIEDSVDIATGFSTDDNLNGIPDECECPGAAYCTCPSIDAPCANPDPGAGCANSLGAGAVLLGGGSSSVFSDDLELDTTGLPPGEFGLYYMGSAMIGPFAFGDGLRCVGGDVHRYLPPILIDPMGTASKGPGIIAFACSTFPASACPMVGDTWNFQFWYRDPGGPCASSFNLSNGWSVMFTD